MTNKEYILASKIRRYMDVKCFGVPDADCNRCVNSMDDNNCFLGRLVDYFEERVDYLDDDVYYHALTDHL